MDDITFSTRSCRNRKKVDYSKFADVDDDATKQEKTVTVENTCSLHLNEPDDFAEVTPPPSKRAKKEQTTKERAKENRSSSKNKDQSHARNSRSGLDDVLYQSQLQRALEISQTSDPPKQDVLTVDVEISSPSKSDSTPTEPKVVASPVTATEPSKVKASHREDPADGKTQLATVDTVKSSARHKETVVVSDEDYNEDDDEDDDDEEEEEEEGESEDSDWQEAQSKSKTAKKPAPTKTKKATTTPMPTSATTGSSVSKKQAGSKTSAVTGSTRPSLATGVSPAGTPARTVGWTPPGASGTRHTGQAGSQQALLSPGSGGASSLRLGLSKRSRVKPLHPSVKVPH